jgi:hydroxylamine reductase
MKITKDMLIADILRVNPKAAQILMASGMGCLGCPASQAESLEQAAGVHGIDLDELIKKLNS